MPDLTKAVVDAPGRLQGTRRQRGSFRRPCRVILCLGLGKNQSGGGQQGGQAADNRESNGIPRESPGHRDHTPSLHQDRVDDRGNRIPTVVTTRDSIIGTASRV